MSFLPAEPEILDARLGWPDAQDALAGAVHERRSGIYSLGWYGTAISRERGSFALVKRGGVLADLLGDRLRLTAGDHQANVYVFGSDDLDWDIHVTRSAFAHLSLLSVERIDVTIEVISS